MGSRSKKINGVAKQKDTRGNAGQKKDRKKVLTLKGCKAQTENEKLLLNILKKNIQKR